MTDQKFFSDLSDADVHAFRTSEEFDEQWYVSEYLDVGITGIDPARHYLWLGKSLGRYPSRAELEKARGIGLHWCIIATPHVLFIAHTLAESLRRHGWSVDIHLDHPEYFTREYHHDYYIVMCAQMFDHLPPGEKRIIYQLEQSASSRWFSDQYLSDIENSFAVLEYSLQNISFLESKGISYPHVNYLPIGTSLTYHPKQEQEKDNDVLFYGDFKSCPRRQRLLDLAETRFSVTRADTLFGEEMKNLIARSKLVLNLHYYEGAQLEMPRIQECISLGVPVVSEGTVDQNDYEYIEGAVTFFETGDEEAMMAAIASVLEDPSEALCAVANAAVAWHRRHSFMFDRFLIGANLLPSDALDNMVSEPTTNGAIYALSLPETIKRRQVFDLETRTPAMQVFDGIRRRPSWIGCGMSYKYLCQSAVKAEIDQFTIMEDDALLSPDHNDKMNIVLSYLDEQKGRWDIFSGVIAHLHDRTNILDVQHKNGIDFVTIDHMTSMVFNIYSDKAIKLIAEWNPNYDNAETNTIDRYLERSPLRTVVAHPYIVGHREELHSTLWGFQNTQYSDMIAESEMKLGFLKEQWLDSNRPSKNLELVSKII